ncbi:MAG: HAMP domain-containing sensor histidine kinase [Gaiellaceae bacterium]
MFRSLRFRLPAIFLAGIAVAGLVASLIAVRLFQDHVESQALDELKQEATGLAQLYSRRAGEIPLSRRDIELATGDRLYFAPIAPGLEIFFEDEAQGEQIGQLPKLRADLIDKATLEQGGLVTLEFQPPGEDRTFLAVAHPIDVAGRVFGALVVAKPKTDIRARWVPLFERLALAFLGGILVSGALGFYFSRRITRPVLALSRAADEVAEGRYVIDLPPVRGSDEIAHLSERFNQMADRLRETEELERNFLMSVSHELRTPLTAIRGHVEALREGLVEDPDARADSLDVLAAETARLERLVGDVLDLAKLDAHRFTVLREEVDMRRLVDRAYATFDSEAKRRAISYEQIVRAEPVITSDGDRVLQIISNLLANAFRWTPDGGRVALELAAANGAVHVAVEDTGPGIPRAEQERIFRAFFSRDGGGTGLGLAIARELAGALGGRIDVRSAPGKGSRFELVLPGAGPDAG